MNMSEFNCREPHRYWDDYCERMEMDRLYYLECIDRVIDDICFDLSSTNNFKKFVEGFIERELLRPEDILDHDVSDMFVNPFSDTYLEECDFLRHLRDNGIDDKDHETIFTTIRYSKRWSEIEEKASKILDDIKLSISKNG